MVAVTKGQTFPFNLPATVPFLQTIANCVTKVKSRGIERMALPSSGASGPRGIRDRPVSARSIGSIRRECLDHVVVVGERHLHHVLGSYQQYYNEVRTHLSHRFGVMCAEQGACVRRRSWADYTINMFEFEFPTGTGATTRQRASCPHGQDVTRIPQLIRRPGSAGDADARGG
jgi:hypothetical protein